MRAYQFLTELAVDNNLVNELELYIANNEEIYRTQFMPLIDRLAKQLKNNSYNHQQALSQWKKLVDYSAVAYVREFVDTGEDASEVFPTEVRNKVCDNIAQKELNNIKQGEYDATNGNIF